MPNIIATCQCGKKGAESYFPKAAGKLNKDEQNRQLTLDQGNGFDRVWLKI
jgi:hypothetical protein